MNFTEEVDWQIFDNPGNKILLMLYENTMQIGISLS